MTELVHPYHWPDPALSVVKRPVPPAGKPRIGWGSILGYALLQAISTAISQNPQPNEPDAGGGGIRGAWNMWLDMTYTGDSADLDPGVDVDDLDWRVSTIFRGYFVDNEIHHDAFDDLSRSEGTLSELVPKMSGDDRQYFAMARSIARGILEEVSLAPSAATDR